MQVMYSWYLIRLCSKKEGRDGEPMEMSAFACVWLSMHEKRGFCSAIHKKITVQLQLKKITLLVKTLKVQL